MFTHSLFAMYKIASSNKKNKENLINDKMNRFMVNRFISFFFLNLKMKKKHIPIVIKHNFP